MTTPNNRSNSDTTSAPTLTTEERLRAVATILRDTAEEMYLEQLKKEQEELGNKTQNGNPLNRRLQKD